MDKPRGPQGLGAGDTNDSARAQVVAGLESREPAWNRPQPRQVSGPSPSTPCAVCGHPFGRHWPEWCKDTRCEVCKCPYFSPVKP